MQYLFIILMTWMTTTAQALEPVLAEDFFDVLVKCQSQPEADFDTCADIAAKATSTPYEAIQEFELTILDPNDPAAGYDVECRYPPGAEHTCSLYYCYKNTSGKEKCSLIKIVAVPQDPKPE